MALNLILDNTRNNKVTNPGDKKIAQMKQEQNEKRASLFAALEESRAAYKVQVKEEAKAQSLFLIQKNELAKHNETDKDYKNYKNSYISAKKEFYNARSKADLKLSLLQFRTNDFCKANTTNILDLV